jgi:peptidoglycan-N-acetylglucosamine deacetylase
MISIVIPALNEERFLPDCLDSLKKQDCGSEPEIIVVDNGSTDGTAGVAAKFQVRIVPCPRRGVVYARQAGAEAAKGDVIVQVDADTVYPPGWLNNIEGHFARNRDLVGLAGRYTYKGKEAGWAPLERVYRKFMNDAGLRLFGFPAAVSGANFAYKKSAFLKAEGYDPESLYPDQWGIARRISRFGKIYYDHGSVVFTSSRRVAKPSFVICYEIVRNCCHVAAHFVRHCARSLFGRKGERKTE